MVEQGGRRKDSTLGPRGTAEQLLWAIQHKARLALLTIGISSACYGSWRLCRCDAPGTRFSRFGCRIASLPVLNCTRPSRSQRQYRIRSSEMHCISRQIHAQRLDSQGLVTCYRALWQRDYSGINSMPGRFFRGPQPDGQAVAAFRFQVPFRWPSPTVLHPAALRLPAPLQLLPLALGVVSSICGKIQFHPSTPSHSGQSNREPALQTSPPARYIRFACARTLTHSNWATEPLVLCFNPCYLCDWVLASFTRSVGFVPRAVHFIGIA